MLFSAFNLNTFLEYQIRCVKMYIFLAASPFTPLRGAAVVTNLFQLFAHLVSLK